MRAIHGRIKQRGNHHHERGDDRKWLNASTGNHVFLDAESQVGCTGMSKSREAVEAPSGLEPEPQV